MQNFIKFFILLFIFGQIKSQEYKKFSRRDHYSVERERHAKMKHWRNSGTNVHLKTLSINDDCADATNLTPGNLLCGESFDNTDGLELGECYYNYLFLTESTVWYRFTATNDSMIVDIVQTNFTNCAPVIIIWGGFPSGGGCLPGGPSCSNDLVHFEVLNGDPGRNILLTGLTPGLDYLIQVQNNVGCLGFGDNYLNFCIGVFEPAPNAYANTPSLIDACGVAFNGSTIGGYWNNGDGTNAANLDNNNTTTCPTCLNAGDDVPYVINNVSWFSFCAPAGGTWNVTIDNIANCALNEGVQITIFTGDPSNLTFIQTGPNPINPGGAWTSSNFNVATGQCVYIAMDGFAGDICDYSLTLTNVSGGCILLPIEITGFTGETFDNFNRLKWSVINTNAQGNFIIEHSTDGKNFYKLHTQKLMPDKKDYQTEHITYEKTNYYNLIFADEKGKETLLGTKVLIKSASSFDKDPVILYRNNIPFIRMGSPQNTSVSIEVFSMSGKTIYTEKHRIQEGINIIPLPANNLSQGIYLVKIGMEEGKTYHKTLLIR